MCFLFVGKVTWRFNNPVDTKFGVRKFGRVSFCKNFYTLIQYFLLSYCKMLIYIILNIYYFKYDYVLIDKNKNFILTFWNNLFLVYVKNSYKIFYNLLFLLIFNQFYAILYFFNQFFMQFRYNSMGWFNILLIA